MNKTWGRSCFVFLRSFVSTFISLSQAMMLFYGCIKKIYITSRQQNGCPFHFNAVTMKMNQRKQNILMFSTIITTRKWFFFLGLSLGVHPPVGAHTITAITADYSPFSHPLFLLHSSLSLCVLICLALAPVRKRHRRPNMIHVMHPARFINLFNI